MRFRKTQLFWTATYVSFDIYFITHQRRDKILKKHFHCKGGGCRWEFELGKLLSGKNRF